MVTTPTIKETMTAIAIRGKGGPEVLVAEERPTPRPGPGQVLIRVGAAGVNRPDVVQRMGFYPAPKGHSDLPGLEVAGEVAAVGEGAQRFAVGERVMALVNGGGYAEYCLAEEAACLAVPAAVSTTVAAGIPETFMTVWHNVVERGQLKAGEWLLVHGGSSGIGVSAIQVAKALGAKVAVTAGSVEKCAACVALGADVAINYRSEDFVAAIKAATAERGVDVILDMVGGDYVERNIRSLADDGRLVNIAFQKGSKVEVDLMRVMLKRLTLTGSTLRVRSTEVKGGLARQVESQVLPLIADGRIKVPVDSTFPLAEARRAHERMDSGAHVGKIILTVT